MPNSNFSARFFEKPTSMISLCQEGKGSPDALGRSTGTNSARAHPVGQRLMFQIIGAMAEFERALIQERVRAGLRSVCAKGKRLGRPRREVDANRIAALRASGTSWRAISRELGAGLATLYRAVAGRRHAGW